MAPAITSELGSIGGAVRHLRLRLLRRAGGGFHARRRHHRPLRHRPCAGDRARHDDRRRAGDRLRARFMPPASRPWSCMGLGYSMSNPSTARGVLEWFPGRAPRPCHGLEAGRRADRRCARGWQRGARRTRALADPDVRRRGPDPSPTACLCVSLFKFDRQIPLGARGAIRWPASARWCATGTSPSIRCCRACSTWARPISSAFLTLFLTEAVRASQPMAGFAMGLGPDSERAG